MSEHGIPFLDLQAATAELRPQLDQAWARVLDRGCYVGGDEVEAFEREFAASVASPFAVGVGNGLDALAFALQALGVREGDEVVVPAHTFIATWLAVRMLGATPVAAEPESGRFNVSARTIEPLIGARTRAVVVVHLYGEPVEIEPIAELCKTHRIALVEDAAQAHGARRNAKPVGAMGDAAAFSFYPAKNLGALGDAGMLTTASEPVREQVCRLRNYGALAKYEHRIEGRNSRLDSLQAALLRVKLQALPEWNQRRRCIAARYSQDLAGIDGLELPQTLPGNEPVWHLYSIRTSRRDELARFLATTGIETMLHYPAAVYRTPPFAAFGPDRITDSDRIANQQLSLPMGPHLSELQAGNVADAVYRYFRGSARPRA
ncbi:MAG: erythromycin biosynthesis sensory transduction protein eryC1 [Hydrocarboniphaga sp.]|uniref:DegT/DnrJ/EryC1/StrS family aminotransferase n=1 Tax=Hydrocarboniphaga sp. TaxID=2033016 RepID=UPI00260372EA|nr:DegT/DnrJ/EryC1/StrS family aminotransferase [Hydrocarboniphaga sp.]MDB5971547.1 erythromycin biosynthesis sensory transduction protein eryC1 [Hydrocarboniphaga sp.]